MNLLTDDWIPVRPLHGGCPSAISLERLLCGNEHWVLRLPRDDMELAALQLLICLVQLSWIPENEQDLHSHMMKPLAACAFQQGVNKW